MAPKRKKVGEEPSKAKKAAKLESRSQVPDEGKAASGGQIIIEAWATKLERLLKGSNPDTAVIINPEKPRKGCFEVRGSAGEEYVSLLDMPRPFKKLKELDIEDLASQIAKALEK